ncbi:RNA polymerase sigma factor [Streptomyces sp. S1D4-11]|nr:RNA polymerase sigma factor [Streptomyces sp. S1D4-11]
MNTTTDEQRFTELYRQHYADISAYVRRRIDADQVTDIVAEVFATAWRRLDEIPRRAVLPWLYGVARRTLANAHRSNRRRLNLLEALGGEPSHQVGDHGGSRSRRCPPQPATVTRRRNSPPCCPAKTRVKSTCCGAPPATVAEWSNCRPLRRPSDPSHRCPVPPCSTRKTSCSFPKISVGQESEAVAELSDSDSSAGGCSGACVSPGSRKAMITSPPFQATNTPRARRTHVHL